MTRKYQRILITGGTGFLGRHVTEAVRGEAAGEVVSVGRSDYDLLQTGAAEAMIKDVHPDAVIHLAATVGGIIANKKYPVTFFNDNILINTQTLRACAEAEVPRFLTFIGGCSYPARAPSPIAEQEMWNGYPQNESAPYSVAKKVMLVQCEAYRRERGTNASVLIPGNVYGEYDNFNEEYSHVIPALLRRFIEARESGAPSVACFGSGKPTRDFVYAGDVAKTIPWFLEHYNEADPVNISSGTRTSIKELAESVKAATGYPGELAWDTSKPDGQMDKIFDVTRLKALGISCDTPLAEGLQRTADWFLTARDQGEVRL